MRRRSRYAAPLRPPPGRRQRASRSWHYVSYGLLIALLAGLGLLVGGRLWMPAPPHREPTPTPSLPDAGLLDQSSKREGFDGSAFANEANVIRRNAVLGVEDRQRAASARPRQLNTYAVVAGDTLFGIALKFGLRPETILWSNYETLKDNPDLLSVGQKLTIPPENGLIVQVERGDTIEGLARRFGVPAERIVKEPLNGLRDINQLLQIGQRIFVPGGERETVIWQIPKLVEVRRSTSGVRVYRVGKCGEVAIPPLGSGNFLWPANRRYLSGYNFSSVHPGIDIAGRLGEPIYASDAGTVIYAGYSLNAAGRPVGYGQYVVLDHGNGYQTLYAHASQLFVRCGQQVQRGQVIAAIGSVGRSTGPHLHYEIRYLSQAVNPWALLR
jgi:murein DD-endopeptidase MepM/ murein hydrolase activator NlpD